MLLTDAVVRFLIDVFVIVVVVVVFVIFVIFIVNDTIIVVVVSVVIAVVNRNCMYLLSPLSIFDADSRVVLLHW